MSDKPDLHTRLRAEADAEDDWYPKGGRARHGELLREAAAELEALRRRLASAHARKESLERELERSKAQVAESPFLAGLLAAAKADAAMWRRRAERLQAWFALPPDQRHPLGPEFTVEPDRTKPGGGGTYMRDIDPAERQAVIATMGDSFAPGSPMNSIPPEHPHFLTLPMTVLDASDPQAQEFMRIVDEAAAVVEHGAVISTGEELAAFLRQDAGETDPARLVLDEGRLIVDMPTSASLAVYRDMTSPADREDP